MNKLKLKIAQYLTIPAKKMVDTELHWVVLFADGIKNTEVKKVPYGELLLSRYKRDKKTSKDPEPLLTDLPNKKGSQVSFAKIKPSTDQFMLLSLARKLVAFHNKNRSVTIHLLTCGFKNEDVERVIEAIISASAATSFDLPDYKKDQKEANSIVNVVVHGHKFVHGFKRSLAEAEGNGIARYLSILPPNKLTPTEYLQYVRELAKENNWELEFLDIAALKRRKAGAFLAVVQGSPNPDAGIIRLKYKPEKAVRKTVALVGKGICYDTGGTNLKPAEYMYGMH